MFVTTSLSIYYLCTHTCVCVCTYVWAHVFMQSSPTSLYFLTLRSKSYPQQPIFKQPHSVIPLMWETNFYIHTIQKVQL